jgi:hypothetical protein
MIEWIESRQENDLATIVYFVWRHFSTVSSSHVVAAASVFLANLFGLSVPHQVDESIFSLVVQFRVSAKQQSVNLSTTIQFPSPPPTPQMNESEIHFAENQKEPYYYIP